MNEIGEVEILAGAAFKARRERLAKHADTIRESARRIAEGLYCVSRLTSAIVNAPDTVAPPDDLGRLLEEAVDVAEKIEKGLAVE